MAKRIGPRGMAMLIHRLAVSRDKAALAELEAEVIARTRELERSRRELQDFFDAVTSFTAKIGLDGRILLVNRTAQLASGYPLDQLLKMNFVDGPWWTYDRDVHARVRRAFDRARAGSPVSYDERVKVAGDRLLTVNLTLVPIPAEKPEWIVAEGRDVTDRNQAYELLRERSEQLSRANADLEMFASTASHDLQDPLRKMIALASLLAKRDLDAPSKDLAARIETSARRLSKLVTDLLAMSRTLRDAQPFEAVDLAAAARAALSDLDAKDAKIEIAPLPVVRGQPDQLRRLFQNLLSNALKFRRAGVEPRVVIEPRPAPAGFVAFAVSDNGIGFRPELAEEAFQPFRRLNPRHEFEGSGMGLAICRKIMARHGGWISAEPVPGQGATFVVLLPSGPSVK